MAVLTLIRAPRLKPISKTAGVRPRYRAATTDGLESSDRTVATKPVPERCMFVLIVSIGKRVARIRQPATAPATKFCDDDSAFLSTAGMRSRCVIWLLTRWPRDAVFNGRPSPGVSAQVNKRESLKKKKWGAAAGHLSPLHAQRGSHTRTTPRHRAHRIRTQRVPSEVSSDADARGEEGLSVVHVQCDPAALSQDGLGVLAELAQH